MTTGYEAKCRALLQDLATLGRVAVAFSGGVDSSVLLHAAHAALGSGALGSGALGSGALGSGALGAGALGAGALGDGALGAGALGAGALGSGALGSGALGSGALGSGALGVIADSPSLPRSELEAARRTAADIGVRLVEVRTSELADPRYAANLGDRCYHCKSALFRALDVVCADEGIRWQAFGEITDDAQDERPGGRAARERGVLAPLVRAGFTKGDVRRYAREAGMSVADKPAGACLASRIPRGTPVTRERLATVEAAEDALRRLGLSQLRVRHRGRLARLEVGEEELPRARRLSIPIAAALRAAGFEDHELAVYHSPGRAPATPATPAARAARAAPVQGAPDRALPWSIAGQ